MGTLGPLNPASCPGRGLLFLVMTSPEQPELHLQILLAAALAVCGGHGAQSSLMPPAGA